VSLRPGRPDPTRLALRATLAIKGREGHGPTCFAVASGSGLHTGLSMIGDGAALATLPMKGREGGCMTAFDAACGSGLHDGATGIDDAVGATP
jgi:hypothetical protein